MSASLQRRRITKESLACQFCHYTFSKTDHLERHLRSHTKERPFGCGQCGKSFGRRDTLSRHERSHKETATAISAKSIPSESVDDPGGARSVEHGNHITWPVSNVDGLDMGETPMAFMPTRYPSSNGPHAEEMVPNSLQPNGSLPLIVQPSDIEPLPDNWYPGFDVQEPTWLVAPDFDIDVLNSIILETTGENRNLNDTLLPPSPHSPVVPQPDLLQREVDVSPHLSAQKSAGVLLFLWPDTALFLRYFHRSGE